MLYGRRRPCKSRVLERLHAPFAMAHQEEVGAAALDEEIKPYKIHVSRCDAVLENLTDTSKQVSSKYLGLTRQKLELTRLPHDIPGPRCNEWWEPKPTVEPLIDYW